MGNHYIKIRWCLLLMSGLIGTLIPAAAWSDSFRCGRNLVRNGDGTQELIQQCGTPQSRDYAVEEFWSGGQLYKSRVARWHYKDDDGRLERIVVIYQDEIIAVRTGQR